MSYSCCRIGKTRPAHALNGMLQWLVRSRCAMYHKTGYRMTYIMEITSSSPTKPKIPAHTYSRLKNFEICPRRYYECDVKKAWPEPPSEQLQWGDAVHKAIATALKTGTALPLHMRGYQPWLDKVHRTAGNMLVE